MPSPLGTVTFIARYARMADASVFQVSRPTAAPAVGSDHSPERRYSANNKRDISAPTDRVTLSAEAEAIRALQVRDRQVRAHEAAHAAIGGAHAGHPTYTLEQGPDGSTYAVAGEVSIDTSRIPGDPQATLEKAEIVRRAALAPLDPSPADRAIAAKATQMAGQARRDLIAGEDSPGAFTLAPQDSSVDRRPPRGGLLNVLA
ncbi:SprA-related family protein [Geoalkalibacter ferrihydriticus]|uniref:SprA-related family protein n=1 Tax=Geoalkalibacter ferrihydriticus TaxID=392333 RepID=A0A1G9ILL7_9BACT|nr:putative metalloprotease CJM1_0395 family protein [Geoalkalibacter ferrihydriticus]SDL26158.1 SprA-related family protein [Geoalkalibacter ferrihydriticus]